MAVMHSRIVSNGTGCSSRRGPQGRRKRTAAITPPIASIHAGVATVVRDKDRGVCPVLTGVYIVHIGLLPWSGQPRACTRRSGRLSALVRFLALRRLPPPLSLHDGLTINTLLYKA